MNKQELEKKLDELQDKAQILKDIYEQESEAVITEMNSLNKNYSQKKWQFCLEKRCYRCKRNIEEISKEEEVVTGCKFCNSSFVE